MRVFIRFRLYKDTSFSSFQNMMLSVMSNFGFSIVCFIQRQSELLTEIEDDSEKIKRFTDSLKDIIVKINGNIRNGKIDTTGLSIFDMNDYYSISGYVKKTENADDKTA